LLKYIVIGRVGVGRKTFLKSLIRNGVSVCKFYTTDSDADPEFFDKTEPACDDAVEGTKMLVRESGGFVSFTTKERFNECRVIAADLAGLKEICAANPTMAFRIINVQMADDDRLLSHIASFPIEKRIAAEEKFITECLDENEVHEEFEKLMANGETLYGLENVITMHALTNDATDNSPIFGFHEHIKLDTQIHTRVCSIISDLMLEGLIVKDVGGSSESVRVRYHTQSGESKVAPISVFAEFVSRNREGMLAIFESWLTCENISRLD
jgi:hypothetical protein